MSCSCVEQASGVTGALVMGVAVVEANVGRDVIVGLMVTACGAGDTVVTLGVGAMVNDGDTEGGAGTVEGGVAVGDGTGGGGEGDEGTDGGPAKQVS